MALLLRLFLVVTVLASSVLMAPMRGQSAGLSQIEICSEAGTRTVTVDAQGNPAPAHHLCPDCLACLAMGPLPQMAAVGFGRVALPLAYPLPQAVVVAGRRAIDATARDPPLPV